MAAAQKDQQSGKNRQQYICWEPPHGKPIAAVTLHLDSDWPHKVPQPSTNFPAELPQLPASISLISSADCLRVVCSHIAQRPESEHASIRGIAARQISTIRPDCIPPNHVLTVKTGFRLCSSQTLAWLIRRPVPEVEGESPVNPAQSNSEA
jgi:hypothetical protein